MLVCIKGGAESNSFVTLDEADTIIKTLPDDPGDWDALTDEEKEYRLTLAAQMLNNFPFIGERSYRNQNLAFPRDCTPDSTEVPDEVKEAQVFIAYSVIHRGLSLRGTDVTEGETDRVTQISLAGLLSVSMAGLSQSIRSSFLDQAINSAQFPVFVRLSRWMSKIRGRVVRKEAPTKLTTTTTV